MDHHIHYHAHPLADSDASWTHGHVHKHSIADRILHSFAFKRWHTHVDTHADPRFAHSRVPVRR